MILLILYILLNINNYCYIQVVFSDESTFQTLEDKATFVRRRPREQHKPEYIVNTVKHPASIMVWSCISSRGAGQLYIVQGTMKQDQYKTVLQTTLIPQIREWFPNGEKIVFMQDGAPCHTAKSIKTFFANESIELLDWPGNSPDMNPNENLWELVKRKISTEIITSKQKLTEQLIDVWVRDPEVKALTSKCINSMPRRVKALIDSKGLTTKY